MIFNSQPYQRCFLENKNSQRVVRHFDTMVDIFDTIYEGGQSSLLYRAVDVLFRKNILDRRMKLILKLCGACGKDILDIGCGPGRYAVLLAKAGSRAVLGIDVSSGMIGLARRSAVSNNVAGICSFQRRDFISSDFGRKFDIVIASGLFDYIEDPRPFLSKIAKLVNDKALISFPVKWTALTPVRMLWLKKRKCPSYYYSRREILCLARDCGLKVDLIRKIGSFLVPGNYIVVCRPGSG